MRATSTAGALAKIELDLTVQELFDWKTNAQELMEEPTILIELRGASSYANSASFAMIILRRGPREFLIADGLLAL